MIPGTVKAFSPPLPGQRRSLLEHPAARVEFLRFRPAIFRAKGPLCAFAEKPVCSFID
jgi:hypothetical protein